VIEAFVPATEAMPDSLTPGTADRVEVRSMTVDAVVLSISRMIAGDQRAEGHHIELRHGMPVILRPWSVRYSTPEQLEAMADAAGLTLETRFGSWGGEPFSDASTHHVSVYRRT
jgi:hypothetical protein